MENPALEMNNEQEPQGSSPVKPTKLTSWSAATPGIPQLEGEGGSESNNDHHCQKLGPCQSLVGSSQIQFQLFVEEVKVELKELTQNGGNKNHPEPLENRKKDATAPDNDKKKVKVERTGWGRYIGVMLAISASMLFALCFLIVKSLPQYHPYNVSIWRFQGLLWPAIPIALYYRVVKKERIFDIIFPITAPGRMKMLLFLFLRALAGATAITLQFYSMQYINMADSSVICSSLPVFVSLASHFLLGEKSGFIPVICGVITLGGVVIITRPPILTGGEEFDKETLIGSGLALISMIVAATTFLLLRCLRQMHFSVVTLFFGLWGTLQSLALSTTMSSIQLPESFHHWLMALALAALTFIGQICMTIALKYEQAGTISLCRSSEILFAYLWQFIFLGVVPDQYSMIGGGIVIFGIVVAALRKYLSELPESNQTRRRWWILLV